MKQRPLAGFCELTRAELDTIYRWFLHKSYAEIAAQLAKPRAEGGFDTRVSLSTLRSFYRRMSRRYEAEHRAEAAEAALARLRSGLARHFAAACPPSESPPPPSMQAAA